MIILCKRDYLFLKAEFHRYSGIPYRVLSPCHVWEWKMGEAS
uniref:Uncharacterized protein n=1 Tax=Arundo donax TaxID=35708 RepID=A0A0A9AZD5_ARUDO